MLLQAPDLKETLKNLRPHEHLCLIYETAEEWQAAIVPFLLIGLEQNEKCIYIVDDHTPGQVRNYFREEGIDVDATEASGQLGVIHSTEVYMRDGFFDPDRMIALLIAETERAIAEGYTALRVMSEASWILRGHPGSEKLMEYEAKVDRDLFPKYPCVAICQYDRWKFDPEIIRGAIMTHPLLVRGNRVYHNFYYVPPQDFLSQKSSRAEVQYWLDSLEKERDPQEHSRFPTHQHSEKLEELVERRMTRIQELERQRAEIEKLAATGRMAAHIAHEINNPLGGIKNSFLLIKDAVSEHHPYYEYVGRIDKEIDRIPTSYTRCSTCTGPTKRRCVSSRPMKSSAMSLPC